MLFQYRHSLLRSPCIGLLLDTGDCMMSENDPGVLVAPPSATLPNTDLTWERSLLKFNTMDMYT